MSPEVFDKLRELVGLLVDRRYDEAITFAPGTRLSAGEIEEAITSYGRKLVRPPVTWPGVRLDIVDVRGAKNPTWSVRTPLWTEEEGESDLWLEVTVVDTGKAWRIEVDDIHVL